MVRKKKTATGLTNTIRSSLLSNREDIMRQNSRKKRGKSAHDSGTSLEKKIESLCFWYRDDENPEWELIRNYEGVTKSEGRQKQTQFTSVVNSCDFSFWTSNNFGFVMGGMIEVKNRQSNRINKTTLSHHQKDQLIRLEKLGHLGLVLVCLVENEIERCFLVPITYWWRGKKTSHNCDDLSVIGYELSFIKINDDHGREILVPDILTGIKKIDAEGGYKELPKEYNKNYDNKKLHPQRAQYSTIDDELRDITIDLDTDD